MIHIDWVCACHSHATTAVAVVNVVLSAMKVKQKNELSSTARIEAEFIRDVSLLIRKKA